MGLAINGTVGDLEVRVPLGMRRTASACIALLYTVWFRRVFPSAMDEFPVRRGFCV